MWHINDDHMLTAGIRYDYLSEYKNQFNYRFAYGGQYRDLYGKILFGTAYRVPVYREYLKIGVENPNLRPEKLRTFETQIGYIFTRADLSLTYYYNHYTDFIDEVSVVEINGETLETPDEYSINLKVRRISGLEFNSTIYPVSDLTLKFSADYLLLAKEEIGEIKGVETEFDYNINPRSLFFLDGFSTRLLASYRFLDKFNVGFNVTYKGKKQTPPNYQEDSVKKTNSNADGYLRMDINGSIDFNRHFQLHGKVSNVIGTRAYSPPYSKIEKYDTELPGRSVYVGLRLKY